MGGKASIDNKSVKKLGKIFPFSFLLVNFFLLERRACSASLWIRHSKSLNPLILLKSPGLFPTPSPDVRTVRQCDKRCITVSIFLVILSCTDSPTNIFKIKSTTYSTYNMLIFNCSRYIQKFSC